ncbi:hypothetical protein LV164_004225 [Aspergillus fumigatus]|nr:hypothetical protein LV164_004225 [Aspergillus fumigatus]
MIFVDQPVGTGLSYVDSCQDIPTTSEIAAEDMYIFLQIFMTEVFPERRHTPFHIAGESYAGHYIPTLSREILRQNQVSETSEIPLRSILIGNGYVSPLDTLYGYYETLCTTKPGVDEPVFNQTRCQIISEKLPRCISIYEVCYRYPDELLCKAASEVCGVIKELYHNESHAGGRDPFDITRICEVDHLCFSQTLEIQKYINKPGTWAALGVPEAVRNFSIESTEVASAFETTTDLYSNVMNDIKYTLEHGVDVLIYNGNLDLACNTAGNLRWAEALRWNGQAPFTSEKLKPWYSKVRGSRVKAGSFKEVFASIPNGVSGKQRFAFVTVDKSGHMVPLDQPEVALDLYQSQRLEVFLSIDMESKKESVDITVCQSSKESANDERTEVPGPQIHTYETQLEIVEDADDDVYALCFPLLVFTPYKLFQSINIDLRSVSPEVRASVPADDEDIPVNTFRAWFLGIVGTVVLTALNQFFQLHSPPRRFNQKEHCIVAIMASLVTAFDNGSLATDVYVAFEKFLHVPISLGYRFMFLLTTQALSFGIAGLFHKFLVEPAACVWPGVLPTCSMLYTMHQRNKQNEETNGWKISRMKLFAVVILCGTLYQFLPGFLFTGLTTFAWITWIFPNNVTINQVFGAISGMDLLPMTLDWNQITGYLGSPLLVPTWALTNVFCGSIFFLWVVSPALHWSNVWEGMYMPFSSSKTFDNTVHTALYHHREIWYGLLASIGKSSGEEKPDIHARLMKKYKQVPTWWYGCTFLGIFSISIAFLYAYDTGLPWYGLILAITLHVILLLPTGIMMAYCNIKLSTAVISALVAGYIWPGKMMNNVVFKIFTLVSSAQGLGYISVMKLAHYMKIPPRVTFAAQCTGIIVSWLTQTAVNIWAMGNVKDICTSKASNNQFLCPLAAGYATNATFWGLIGPKRLFSEGSMYRPMLWFFFIGAASPLVLYLLDRRFPRAMLRKIHLPAIFASTASIPPATAANYMAWGIVGLYFNGHLKHRYRPWWMKYNYILSAGLDAALAVGNFLIFFCLAYPGIELKWFGNDIAARTADGLGVPLRTVERGQTFGPRSWN